MDQVRLSQTLASSISLKNPVEVSIPLARIVWILWAEPESMLSYDYREHIQSWIYNICLGGTEIGKRLHRARYTLYNFALLPQMPEWTPHGLKSLNGAWELHIGSAYREVLALVQSYAALAEGISVAGIDFESVEVCFWPLDGRRTRFHVGPITIVDKKSKDFLRWDDSQFNEAVCAALCNRYQYFFGQDPGPFSFSFVIPPQKKLIQNYKWNYVAYSGICQIKGPQSLRMFAQQVGLGMRPSAGFGTLF